MQLGQHLRTRLPRSIVLCGFVATAMLSAGVPSGHNLFGAEPTAAKAKKKYKDFSEVTKNAKKYDGLFRMYQVDDHLYAEIRPSQFKQMYMAPIAIARGMASAGTPLNFGDEWILSFRRVGDRVDRRATRGHFRLGRRFSDECDSPECDFGTASVRTPSPVR